MDYPPYSGTVTDHYFTTPAAPAERREITVGLAGREVTVQSAGGVFSAAHLDSGTKVLLDHVPPPPSSGDFLDLGCGWGPIALSLALQAPAAAVYAVDINELAVSLTHDNAARLGLSNVSAGDPEAIHEALAGRRLRLIWSNPPIRVGKDTLHALLSEWLPLLDDDGEAYLVVSKNLGSDSLQRWISAELGLACERAASSKGFRVLRVTRRAHP